MTNDGDPAAPVAGSSGTNAPNAKGAWSLVLAILGLTVCCCPFVCGIAAVILGSGQTSGVGRAGFILGWVVIAKDLLCLPIVALWLLTSVATLSQ
jgi:hypothetical protein